MKKIFSFILILILAAFFGCSSGGSKKTDKRLIVCVAGTANKTGNKKLNSLSESSSQIFNSSLHKTKAFRMIERDRLGDILKELNLRETGLLDMSKSKKVGKMLGVDALFFINILSVSQSERSKTTLTGLVTDNKNKVIESLSVIVEARLVDIESGEILASSKETVEMKNTYQLKDKKKSAMDIPSTVNKAIEKCSGTISKDIANQAKDINKHTKEQQ